MSTRCRIGYVDQTGSVFSIYCHHDGYLEGVGQTLVNHYSSLERVVKLVSLGDTSSLENTIAETKFYSKQGEEEEDFCMRKDSNKDSYLQPSDWDIAYFYLFENGIWLVREGKSWEPVEGLLEKLRNFNDCD